MTMPLTNNVSRACPALRHILASMNFCCSCPTPVSCVVPKYKLTQRCGAKFHALGGVAAPHLFHALESPRCRTETFHQEIKEDLDLVGSLSPRGRDRPQRKLRRLLQVFAGAVPGGDARIELISSSNKSCEICPLRRTVQSRALSCTMFSRARQLMSRPGDPPPGLW